jgi:hypothetical protein
VTTRECQQLAESVSAGLYPTEWDKVQPKHIIAASTRCFGPTFCHCLWFAPAFSPVAARDCQAGPKGAMAARGTGAMGGSIVPGSSQNARTYGTLGADTLVISPGSRNALRACTQWPSAGPRLLKITPVGDTNLLPSLCMYCPP